MTEKRDALTVLDYRDHVLKCNRREIEIDFDIENLPPMFLLWMLENLYIAIDHKERLTS